MRQNLAIAKNHFIYFHEISNICIVLLSSFERAGESLFASGFEMCYGASSIWRVGRQSRFELPVSVER